MRDLSQEFKDAFERYSDELFRYCLLRTSDRERSLELTQEMYLRVWDYAQKGNDIGDLRPFMYRTLRNLIIDEYRKKKIYSLESMVNDDEGMTLDTLLPADESNTLKAAMTRYDATRALALLSRVPEPYREALALRYIEGLSPGEIAAIIGESENAVSVRVHRGLKKLRALLEAEGAVGDGPQKNI